MVDSICAMMICLVMVYVFRWSINVKPRIIPVLVFILYSIVSPSALFLMAYAIKLLVWPEGISAKITYETLFSQTIYNIIFFITCGGVIYATLFRIRFTQQKETTIKAQSLAKETQLKMLRYQINPHFLFNILNSLHALVDENKENAKKLIVDLSEYYRAVLDKQIQQHLIKHEVEIIEKYLKIQKIRFEESFIYEVHLDEKASNLEIPIFIVHLLIENAVKYGVKNENGHLIIKLDITLKKGILLIQVGNTGRKTQIQEEEKLSINGTGTDLENVKQRLDLFFDKNYSFHCVSKQIMLKFVDLNS